MDNNPNTNNRDRLTALIITLLLALLLLFFLLWCRLTTTPPQERQWPPEKESEIIMQPVEEKFVEVYSTRGDNVVEPVQVNKPGASSVADTRPTQVSHDAKNVASTKGNTTNVTTSKQESPAKVNTENKNVGNANPDAAAQAAAEAERQQRARENMNAEMANRFSGQGNADGAVNKDNTDGTRATGQGSGGRGLGMTASHDIRPRSTKLGEIVVTVVVMPDGSVQPGSSKLLSANGQAGTDQALIAECLKAAYRCRFAREEGQVTKLAGTIRFIWK